MVSDQKGLSQEILEKHVRQVVLPDNIVLHKGIWHILLCLFNGMNISWIGGREVLARVRPCPRRVGLKRGLKFTQQYHKQLLMTTLLIWTHSSVVLSDLDKYWAVFRDLHAKFLLSHPLEPNFGALMNDKYWPNKMQVWLRGFHDPALLSSHVKCSYTRGPL